MNGGHRRRAGQSETGQDEASVTPLVAGWFVGGVVAVALLMATTGLTPAVTPEFWVLVAMMTLAETAAVDLKDGRSGLSQSLLEVFVAVALLMLDPVSAVVAVVCGVATSQLMQRIALQKLLFNLGQHAVAATVAAALLWAAPGTGPVSPTRTLAVILAILAYGRINSVALASIFARLGLASLREQLTERPGFLIATSLGNASVGAIAVALWATAPQVVWVIAGPILALYLSYGSSFRIESLLSDVSSERDRLDRVVSGVQEGIVLMDAQGLIRLWNQAMTRITGVPEADALGRSGTSLLTGVDSDGTSVDPVQVLREELPTATYAVALRGVNDDPVEVRIEHTLLRDDRGRCMGDVVLVQDLSREREAHALKEDFVARVSHELRTPLSPLRGYAQILLDAGDRVPEHKRIMMLETMVERVGHLERLIDDLLLVSKVVSGGLSPADEMTAEAADLEGIVTNTLEWVDRDHPDREVRLQLDGDGYVAWADPLRVGQIVVNLVKNACKYATPGTPVDVTVSRSGGEVRVDIRDHGPGIPDDKLEAIFDRFQRLEDPQRMQTSGLGLGLYIARHLATVMGGRLDVESIHGEGSTFTLVLPAATAEQLQSVDGASPRPTGPRVYRRDEHNTSSPSPSLNNDPG